METKVFELLNKLGCPCHIKGRDYIETAINLVFENQDISITKELYPQISKIHKTTPPGVERAIRHAIELVFKDGNIEMLEAVFGNTIDPRSGKLTNSAFVFGAVKYLKVFGNHSLCDTCDRGSNYRRDDMEAEIK